VYPEIAPPVPAVPAAVLAEPDDDSPPPPGEDTLTATARRDFLADLLDGRTPGIRALKERYGVGQPRATRIRDELKAALA
jgi:hypothetical protein